MNASSYLEGFLTVYGWMMYETLYQLFSMIWLVFLPFLMLLFNFFRDTITDNSNSGFGFFKSNLFSFLFMLAILFFCVVPLDEITITGSKVNTVCDDNVSLSDRYNDGGSSGSTDFQFDVDEKGKVPVIPSLVMRLAQGTNNVIYKNIPCISQVTNMALAFETSRIRDTGLKDHMSAFTDQCYKKARDRILKLEEIAGRGTKKKVAEGFARQYVNRLGGNWGGLFSGVDEKKEIRFQEEYMGSDLMLYMMDADSTTYANIGAYLNNAQLTEWQKFATSKLYSDQPVDGIPGNHPDMSSNQQTGNLGPVSCSTWWATIKPQLKEDAFKDLTINAVKSDEAAKQCWLSGVVSNFFNNACQNLVKAYYKLNDPNKFEEKMDEIIFKSQVTNSGYAALSNDESTGIGAALNAGALASIIGFIPGLGNNVLENITDSAVSFYAEMFMYKIIAKFLQPMLLMGIFAFWGIYLIVSSYRGETVFRGLVLIFAITLLPSIWAIADHLDSYLYQAMFPYNDVKDYSDKSSSTVERMVLDGASTVFYVIFPFILLYMISEAGGPKGGIALQSTDKQSSNLGRTTGGLGGGLTPKVMKTGMKTGQQAANKGFGIVKSMRGGKN